MRRSLALALLVLAPAAGEASDPKEVVVRDLSGPGVEHTADFAIVSSPYAHGGNYLRARAVAGTPPGSIRIKAPAGAYYVYVAWVRHPRGGRDVVIRAAEIDFRVDQSRLACRMSPDDAPRDHMQDFDGSCNSGMYRLFDRPMTFAEGDVVEVRRSDTRANTFTSLDYVVFSPHLYLDDLGNDAAHRGSPTINLRHYGGASDAVGYGLTFLKDSGSVVEWTIPAEGDFLLSANPNRGPNRAREMPLEIELGAGSVVHRQLAGRADQFGRSGWQDLAVLRATPGAKLRARRTDQGLVAVDLLRLTPVNVAGLTEDDRPEDYTVQWEKPPEGKPWRQVVEVAPDPQLNAKVERIGAIGPMHAGVRIRIPRRTIEVLGANPGSPRKLYASQRHGAIAVKLADDYGFRLSLALLQREPFVWLKDLGIFACRGGDFASHRKELDALIDSVGAARKGPFQATSDRYFAWTGYDEARGNLVDRALEFAYDHRRPAAPRVSEALAAMPEADYRHFADRIADVRHRRMFLGWPNVAQEFYVLSNGTIGVSSGSSAHTGHPPAPHFTVAFGAGEPPTFRLHGDPEVAQTIDDGYHLVVHSRWREGPANVAVSACAYPLTGEEVRSGNEPLAAFCRLSCSVAGPLWLRIKPDHWVGPKLPLTDLGKARIESGRLLVGNRIVLAFKNPSATIASARDDEALLRLDPSQRSVDVVIPFVAVDAATVDRAVELGFDAARAKTKQNWEARLAKGTRVSVPDPVVVNQYLTLYPRTLVAADLDVDGNYALKTSPIVYDTVWLHATAYGIEGLSRRGYFEDARRYLEAGFRWQGSQASDVTGSYTTWEGFFNAPPRYPVPLWLNYQGWFQWAAARYFLYSNDRGWLDEKLPALIKSLEWTRSQRRLTMKRNADGSLLANYGWLPAGRVTDGSRGTGTFTDCVNWMGFRELTTVLKRIGHPRAAEFTKEADDYRNDILRGLKRSIARRDPVHLNDGTFVPYVPAYLESEGHERSWWYAAIVDGHVAAVPGTGVIPAGCPIEDWFLHHFEDNLAVMAPNLADEGHFLGQAIGYLRRDQPQHAIYTFYSCLATQMARQTMTTYEHRSHGAGRVYDLAPWPLYYFGETLLDMLCYDEGDEVVYGRATPRAWLDPGKTIRVERLQTRFGPTSFTLVAAPDRIAGTIEPAARYRPAAARLRLRINGKLKTVKLNGRLTAVDATGAVALPLDAGPIDVEATVER